MPFPAKRARIQAAMHHIIDIKRPRTGSFKMKLIRSVELDLGRLNFRRNKILAFDQPLRLDQMRAGAIRLRHARGRAANGRPVNQPGNPGHHAGVNQGSARASRAAVGAPADRKGAAERK